MEAAFAEMMRRTIKNGTTNAKPTAAARSGPGPTRARLAAITAAKAA